MWDKVQQVQDLYYHLDKMPDADKLWDYVLKYDPMILTAIPKRTSMPNAEQNKRDWVAKHLGTHIPVFIGPYSKNKQKYSKPGYILIDDRPDNIKEWNRKGGTGILHTSASDTISQLKSLEL